MTAAFAQELAAVISQVPFKISALDHGVPPSTRELVACDLACYLPRRAYELAQLIRNTRTSIHHELPSPNA
jgi:hypothetical protein